MNLLLQYPPLLLVLCTLIAGGAAAWGYLRTTPPLPTSRRTLLAALRFGTFFLIAFLLFEPILRRTKTRSEPPVLAVLLDDSQSTSLGSATEDSSESGRSAAIRSLLADLDLPGDVEVRAFRFAGETNRLKGDADDWSAELQFDGERTNIAAALNAVREGLRDANLTGVLLVSDGRYNTGSNPLYVAERYPVPIHTLVVGDTTAQRDVLIGRIIANRVAYVGAEQPVEVEVQAVGFAGQRLTIRLADGGRELGSSTVDVAGEEAQIPVSLSYVPETAGLRTLTVSVTTLEGELTHENNRQMLPVRVLEQKRQVLLLAGAPSPDVAAVRQILQADPNIELSVRVQKSGSEFYEGPFPSNLDPFDALVLVGFPGSATDVPHVRPVRQALDGGTPALLVLTRNTNLARLGNELGDALPATTRGERNGWMEALPNVSAAGAQHPVMAVEGASPVDWKRLPPLAISESRWQPSPDAQVLATVEVRGIPLDDPLIVIRSRAGTRTAAILGAGTWRWKNVPSDLTQWEDLWPQMLTNSLQWITAARDQRPVRIRPATDVFAGDEPVRFSGEVYDESLRPLPGAVVELKLTADDGREYPFRLEDVGNGRYQLETRGLPEGVYSYEATARRGDVELGTDAGSFAVGGLSVEHRDTRADPVLMRQIAARSGGTALQPGDASQLSSRLADTATMEPRTATTVSESNLRRNPLFLALIVLLLTTEWVLRKRSGLV